MGELVSSGREFLMLKHVISHSLRKESKENDSYDRVADILVSDEESSSLMNGLEC